MKAIMERIMIITATIVVVFGLIFIISSPTQASAVPAKTVTPSAAPAVTIPTLTTTSGAASSVVKTSAVSQSTTKYVSINPSLVRNDSVGSDWNYSFEVNGRTVSSGTAVTLKAGDKITVSARIVEEDDSKDDIGTASTSHTVTESDLKNGFTMKLDVTVKENGGRYKGNTALWTVTFRF